MLILVNIGIILLVLLCIDGYLNYLLNNPRHCPAWLFPGIENFYRYCDRPIEQLDPNCAQYDSILTYKYIPGHFVMHSREFDNEIHINSQGFRDDEQSLSYPQVIVLGDSYSMGVGVDQADTYASILEEELKVKVLNTGVSSYGTAREFKSIKEIDKDSLKYIIVQYCSNDYWENRSFVLNNDSLRVSSFAGWRRACDQRLTQNKNYFLKRVLNIPRLILRKPKPIRERMLNMKNKIQQSPVDTIDAFLRVIRKYKDQYAGTKFIIFELNPSRQSEHFIQRVNRSRDIIQDSTFWSNASFVDLSSTLELRHYYVLDPHLNAMGHRAVADRIIEHINDH